MTQNFLEDNISPIEIALINAIAYNDREVDQMIFARKSAKRRENGFEGCKNKEECGFKGFYLAKYSKEGLCSDCELKSYPERFYGCLFCRNAEKLKGYCCLKCYSGFTSYIGENIEFITDAISADSQASHRLTNTSISFKFIPRKELSTLPFVEHGKFTKKWPGFYCGKNEQGIHSWIKPNFIKDGEKTKLEVNWDNCHIVLNDFLKSNGITIEEEIQASC